MNVTIVGRGKVGSTLKAALESHGVKPQMLQGRAEKLRVRPDAALVVLAVPDGAIAEVAGRLLVSRGVSVVHVAGARSVDDLLSLRIQGASVGVMHPLASFAAKRGPSLAGVTFVCAGERAARQQARALCDVVGGRFVVAPGTQTAAAYHAAAALVANGAASLADAGHQLLLALGWKERASRQALAGLLRTVADNVERVGVPGALTGPVIRGDAQTVRAHLAALGKLGARHVRAYGLSVPLILSSAARAGLSPRDQARVRAALSATGKRAAR